jgi:hypothetical protein
MQYPQIIYNQFLLDIYLTYFYRLLDKYSQIIKERLFFIFNDFQHLDSQIANI